MNVSNDTENGLLGSALSADSFASTANQRKRSKSDETRSTPSELRSEKQLDEIESLLGEAIDDQQIELTIVMPCLNEADTLATCIEKCNTIIEQHQLSAEVIIADNGSTDGSIEIAKSLGARVVHVKSKGYGNGASAVLRFTGCRPSQKGESPTCSIRQRIRDWDDAANH